MELDWMTPKQAAEKWTITEPIDGRTKETRQKQTNKDEGK